MSEDTFGKQELLGFKENYILGSKEQFIRSAIAAGDLDSRSKLAQTNLLVSETEEEVFTPIQPQSRNRTSSATRQHSTRNETNALQNWRNKMIERKRHQGYISKFLKKPREKLVSSGTEEYRQRQEEREIIDRAIPSIDYGKGYRVGSEFWRQYESIGDDLGGLKMSLKVSERGKPEDLTRIGKPDLIKAEVGENYDLQSVRPQSEYMKYRKAELEPIVSESHQPNYKDLIVLGRNQPEHSQVESAIEQINPNTSDLNSVGIESDQDSDADNLPCVPGPAIRVHEQNMTVEDGVDKQIDTYLYFDKFRGKMDIQYLRMTNIGQTTLYYNWIRQYHHKSFVSQRKDETQRFFFNSSPGSILPGEEKTIPFVFESPNCGKFTETWHLAFRPALGLFRILLKGNSQSLLPDDDENRSRRAEIENLLEKQIAISAAKYVMDKVIEDVRTPPRCPSPDHLYPPPEEEQFEILNPGFYYNHVKVAHLKEIWNKYWGVTSSEEENQDQNQVHPDWDLDLRTLRDKIFTLEDFETIEEEQKVLNDVCHELKRKQIPLPTLSPSDHVRQHLIDTFDNITEQMLVLRRKMQISSTSSFPMIDNRPTSSQLAATSPFPIQNTSSQISVTSVKNNPKDEKSLKKAGSATKKEKSASKGGRDKKDDKKKKKSKTDVKSKKIDDGGSAGSRPTTGRSSIINSTEYGNDSMYG